MPSFDLLWVNLGQSWGPKRGELSDASVSRAATLGPWQLRPQRTSPSGSDDSVDMGSWTRRLIRASIES